MSPSRRGAGVALSLALGALAIAACGSSGAQNREVEATVRSYFSAFAAGNGSELCPLLSQRARRTLLEVVRSDERERGETRPVRSCPEAVQFFGLAGVPKNVRIIAMAVEGTEATVTVKVGSAHQGTVTLRRAGTGWVFDRLPGVES